MASTDSTSNSMFGFLFFILIILYVIHTYWSSNAEPTLTNPMNYMFWLLIVISQFLWGAMSFLSDLPQSTAFINSGIAVFTTWTLLFIPMFTINDSNVNRAAGLNFSQEMNSIFSNVVGYYWVSADADNILSKLNAIDIHNIDKPANNDLVAAKILYGEIKNNKTLIINQLTPSNFECQWETLFEYLFKIAGQNKAELDKTKIALKNVVFQKYSIGKCFWYFYTAIICFSLSIYLMSIL